MQWFRAKSKITFERACKSTEKSNTAVAFKEKARENHDFSGLTETKLVYLMGL